MLFHLVYFFEIILIMSGCVWYVHVSAAASRGHRHGISFPGAGVTYVSITCLTWAWEPNAGPLQEYCMLSTAGPPLQLPRLPAVLAFASVG